MLIDEVIIFVILQAEAERKQRYPDQLAPVRLKSLMVLKPNSLLFFELVWCSQSFPLYS